MSFICYLLSICYTSVLSLNLFLGIFIYSKKEKNLVNKLFFGITAGNALWILGFLLMLLFNTLFAGRMTFAGALISLWFFFLFSFHFPKRNISFKASSILKIVGFAVIVPCLFLILLTPMIVKESYINEKLEIFVTFGYLYPLLGTFFILLMSIGLINLLKNLFSAGYNEIEKNQVRYFFFGSILTIIIGAIPNLILPMFFAIYKFAIWGPIGTIFLILFTAFAISRYHLFDIKVIMTEILVVIMGMVLLFFPFLMPTNTHRVLAVIVFLAFCLIGYLLIRANLKEVKNSELLENKVKERTAELSKAYEELKIRQEEIERWYSLTIGRELRMVELKQKIKEIEKK